MAASDQNAGIGEHQVVLVRPGARSLEWLCATVARLQARDRLAPVSVVVASPYLGFVVRSALGGAGCANVRTLVLRQVAERVAGAAAHRTSGALSGVLEAAAIRQAVRQVGGAFERIAEHRALQESLGVLFREVRHLHDPSEALEQIAAQGTVARAAVDAFRRYESLSSDYYDVPGLNRIAAVAAERSENRWPDELGALVLYLPSRLDAAEIALLSAIGRRVAVRAAFSHFGDPQADRLLQEDAKALATALGLDSPAVIEAAVSPAELACVSAPDPAEETRAVVRRVAADLEAEIPLWRIAVLWTQDDTYGPLVREALDAAGLPWHTTLGRPLSASGAARSLLGLLGLRDRRFARDAVLEWLAGRPPADPGDPDDPLPNVPLSAWDRLTRRAQVLEGPHQWAQRLETLARRAERDWERQQARASVTACEEQSPPPPPPEAGYARAIGGAIGQLERDLRPPADGAGWDEFAEWATRLRERYVHDADSLPAGEREACFAVDSTIADLANARSLESATTLQVFRNTLAAALEARRPKEGRAGVGVLVGTLGTAYGNQLDRVYVLGMAEGLFPARPAADPLTASDGGADPFGRRERQREGDRRAMLGSLAAADGGRVTLSFPRSDGASQALHPSRWLLERMSQRAGEPVYASDLARLYRAEHPWLERINSAHDGVTRSPAAPDLAELRLKDVLAWNADGHDLARHPLASRSDLPLGAALRAGRDRRSREFTRYDGNLAECAATSRVLARGFDSQSRGASSATAVERWATCHFQYFLHNVLRVEATQCPEEEWTITPVDRGTLIHAVYEQFFRELLAAGRCTPGDSFTDADHTRLEEIAQERFQQLEDQGRTGHPLAWENARASILADLHAQMERDETWRRDDALMPALFEQSFGDDRNPDSWPPARVPLHDGASAAFGGSIDRIDLSHPGTQPRRALVIDYKSGRAEEFDGLDDDPVLGGRHIQLALYARALRTGLPDGERIERVEAEYRFVTSKGGFRRSRIVANAAVDAGLDQQVQRVAAGIRAGVFLAVPGASDQGGFENCRYCDFDRICSATRDEAWVRKQDAIGGLNALGAEIAP